MTHPITHYRTANNLTLEAFGEQFGVNKSPVLRWEQGLVKIPIERVAQIAKITGLSRAQLRPDIFSDKGAAA